MTHDILKFSLVVAVSLTVSGCTQTTPSMMNENKPRLTEQTQIDQIPVKEVTEAHLSLLAENYRRYGEGPVELTVSFDPSSRTYTAMKAVNDLSRMAETLRVKGVSHVKTSTLPEKGVDPALSIHYQTVSVSAPKDCSPMPGMDGYETNRSFQEGYRFGCGIETQLARQIYRPADLKGTGTMESSDGRRATAVSEAYRDMPESEIRRTLDRFERSDLQTE